MYSPSLAFLRGVVHPTIARVNTVPIKESSTPAVVYRVWLQYDRLPAGPSSLIIKRIAPDWPGDPAGAEREARVYACLLSQLGLPQPPVYYAGPEPGSDYQVVVIEDLAGTHRFPKPSQFWTMNEILPVVRHYARFHVLGRSSLPPLAERHWLYERHEERLLEHVADLPGMVQHLTDRDIWPDLPGFPVLLNWLLDMVEPMTALPPTLLHNDVYPPNIALPKNPAGDVYLLDWEMAGWGLAEMDLGFMFLQPYRAHCRLDKAATWAAYWAERDKLTGSSLPPEERQLRQRYADALWAVWLIPVAHHVVNTPFPAGSDPARYWQAMLPVLGERLQQLANAF